MLREQGESTVRELLHPAALLGARSQRLSSVLPNRDAMTELQEGNRKYKVGRVMSAYDLADLHDRLPDLWLGNSGEEVSLRDLAKRVNVAIVRAALEQAGEDPLDGEAENVYRLLHDDDVSAGVRIQQRNRLERAGIDVDELESDFVTHQAVHTYLTKGLDIRKESTEETDPIEKHETRIQRLRNRLDAVMEQSLDELQNAGELSIGRVDTTVSLQVYCEDCETQYDLLELLHEDGCNCTE